MVQTAGTLPGAFDRSGNLWVRDGNSDGAGLKRYGVDTFGADGSKTPDVVITSTALSSEAPGMAALPLDPSGNLWVTAAQHGKVIRFSAAHLAISVT